LFESTLATVIAIDIDGETIHFYSAEKGNQKNIHHDAQSYRARPFDDEFFEKLGHILKLHCEQNPSEQLQKVSLILPDQMFLMDTVNIPTIQKSAMQTSLGVAVRNIYKNADALEYKTFSAAQNKQFTTYGLVAVRKELITKLKAVCSSHQISIGNITFSANAAANGAFVLNPKLKNSSFILLDIKEKTARFSVVIKGRTVGYYSLPFGYSILSRTRLAAEDLLFDHSPAELLVLNAKEKAKAKQLTVGEEVAAMDALDPELEEIAEEPEKAFEIDEDDFETKYSAGLNKKTARKLPKFMLRETPTSREAYVYENFRLFMKWTLDLYNNNSSLMNLGAVDTVYVNMPADNAFLYPMVNAEAEENKLKFMPLLESRNQDIVTENLDLFGGFYVKQYNKINNF
jgi:hypothetical protein